jgi:SPP1 gp7 family putative phage head morphogenesis protein
VAVSELKKQIQEGFKRGLNKAKLIAVNEIGNLSGSLERLNALSAGFNLYVWNTALDERVRDSHRPIEGMICSWDDSTIYKPSITSEWQGRGTIGATSKHPRMEMRCRCNGNTITGALPENNVERNLIRKEGRETWIKELGIID